MATDGYEAQGARRSFPSGHRGSSRLPWWEGATYAGIALGATALAGERVLPTATISVMS